MDDIYKIPNDPIAGPSLVRPVSWPPCIELVKQGADRRSARIVMISLHLLSGGATPFEVSDMVFQYVQLHLGDFKAIQVLNTFIILEDMGRITIAGHSTELTQLVFHLADPEDGERVLPLLDYPDMAEVAASLAADRAAETDGSGFSEPAASFGDNPLRKAVAGALEKIRLEA